MMSNIFDFEADEQLPTGANVAVKFSLPEGLVRNLSLYAQSTSRSKTEIVREAIENRLRNDPSWCAGLFFFEKNEEKKDEESVLEMLHKAPKGTLLKVVGLNKDAPDSANVLICNFVRARGRQISFDIPVNFRPTPLNDSRFTDLSSVKLVGGQMVLPQSDQNMGPFGLTQRWIYTIDVKYIWDIDCTHPAFLY
ncbi:TPA: hypothetical protein SI386_003659 [Escherichia coli]|uniref:Uncharacterized protein n=2 Tax=Citrobacter freundii complex TaxID=1344959 RepID=A0A5B0SU17_9ENTR|nr:MULTISPECIES: hypothetical protein [Enterobacteriaceae]HBC5610598.1 hypothetical protein [Klebsiella oxytoca]EFH3471344.1 hypothetical protein [Escherichia coli]EGJ7480991.1 hypothetical protein [Escherichia coli]EII8488539.1 hypothetical protein [Escherichia coli]EJP6600677.1 hypothetical protein [Escherichia coli]